MKLKIFIAVCSIACLFFTNASAQDKVVTFWEGKIPGSLTNAKYVEENLVFDNGAVRIQKVTNPTLSIYLPEKEKANGSAIVICPGGGYKLLAFDHEGIQIAKWFNKLGFAAFILEYRLPNDTIMINKSVGPLQDAQEAIRFVRRNSAQWNVNPAKIGIIGFSAGGHLASTAATHFAEKVYDSDSTSARPDFALLIYPVISMKSEITHSGTRRNLLGEKPSQDLVLHFSNEEQVTKLTPPTFLVHSQDDNAVPLENSINFYLALKRNNIPSELHIFEKGGHGYGMGRESGTELQWPEMCRRWLIQRGMMLAD
ncbi:MAG: alpha/beta hydrolase [Ignavibacteria bacterium]|nr:alpha/beta hydrolase [Ignavibacteria bacterium]